MLRYTPSVLVVLTLNTVKLEGKTRGGREDAEEVMKGAIWLGVSVYQQINLQSQRDELEFENWDKERIEYDNTISPLFITLFISPSEDQSLVNFDG